MKAIVDLRQKLDADKRYVKYVTSGPLAQAGSDPICSALRKLSKPWIKPWIFKGAIVVICGDVRHVSCSMVLSSHLELSHHLMICGLQLPQPVVYWRVLSLRTWKPTKPMWGKNTRVPGRTDGQSFEGVAQINILTFLSCSFSRFSVGPSDCWTIQLGEVDHF